MLSISRSANSAPTEGEVGGAAIALSLSHPQCSLFFIHRQGGGAIRGGSR